MKVSDSHARYRDSLDKGEGRPRLNQTELSNKEHGQMNFS